MYGMMPCMGCLCLARPIFKIKIFHMSKGPWSDKGRKPVMLFPFLGHIISGVFYFCFLYFDQWPAQLLWVTSVYVLFGGYTLLQIAMYGYIGDVTNSK